MNNDSLLRRLVGLALLSMFVFMFVSLGAGSASAQQRGTIELDLIEIESEVPRRVAQFFVQRDRLNYQTVDRQPTFLPELFKSVTEEPF